MRSGASRQDAKEATRLALVEAALELFAAQGFDGPSLDAICARAGFTRGAFYVHFDDRDELIAATILHVLDRLLDEVMAGDESLDDEAFTDGSTSGTGPGSEIERAVIRFVDLALKPAPETGEVSGPPFHQTLEACRRSEDVRRVFVGVLSDAITRLAVGAVAGQRRSRLRTDIDPDEMARLLVLLALGARVAIEVGLPVDVRATRDAALRLLLAPAQDRA